MAITDWEKNSSLSLKEAVAFSLKTRTLLQIVPAFSQEEIPVF